MLVSLSVFLAYVTYKMTGKNGQYAWFVTGFVTLMMNTYVFTLLAMVVVFALSYIQGSPRPEKVFLKMLGRYFRSSEIILTSLQDKPASRSLFTRMHLAYHQQELQLLPAKLDLWGSQLDHSEFPDTSPEQIQAMVSVLASLAGGDLEVSKEELAQRLALRMESINSRCEQMINQGAGLEAKDARHLYRLLGGFRQLSQELIVYTGAAG